MSERTANISDSIRLRERAAHANWDGFDAFLAKVPDVEPEEYDRLSPEGAAAFEKLKQRYSKPGTH